MEEYKEKIIETIAQINDMQILRMILYFADAGLKEEEAGS